jgi:hypothetical protein
MEVLDALGLAVGVIGTSIAIYQWAVINEGKKRKDELQYLLAGVHATAVHKQKAWQNQISLLNKPTTPDEIKVAQAYIRARDDVGEFAALSTALEGTIDTKNSAIVAMMDKYLSITKKTEKDKAA